jgi:hypothetical protein
VSTDHFAKRLAYFARRFKLTGNPLWAWYAFQESRRDPLGTAPMPDWVEDYFLNCNAEINRLYAMVKDRRITGEVAAQRVARALGLAPKQGSGRGNAFTKMRDETDNALIHAKVLLAKHSGEKVEAVIADSQAKLKVDRRAVFNRIDRERRRIEAQAPEAVHPLMTSGRKKRRPATK